ncbi:hypothetical protein D3C87_2194000 [compost metagenome]
MPLGSNDWIVRVNEGLPFTELWICIGRSTASANQTLVLVEPWVVSQSEQV